MNKRWSGGFLIFLLGLILAGVASAQESQPAIVIEIPAKITVAGPQLTLGDLAAIHGATAAELDTLRKIDLGAAPEPGQLRSFTRGYLFLIIRQQGFDKEFTLKMSEQVVVRVAGVSIQAADFEKTLTGLLPPHKPGIIKKWLEISDLPGEIWIGKDDEWLLEPAVVGTWPEVGPVLFKVRLSVSKRSNENGSETPWRRYFNIRGKVRETALLYRPIRDISYHRELRSGDFEQVEAELATGREWVGEFPVKTRSTRLIKRGEVLRDDFIQPVPLVLKDHPVEVMVKGSGVQIRIMGIAKSDGWLGDEIKVMNPASKKLFRAKVIGEEMVEVTLR